MLNTDAHNPLAERRLSAADFVAMNYAQTETGALGSGRAGGMARGAARQPSPAGPERTFGRSRT